MSLKVLLVDPDIVRAASLREALAASGFPDVVTVGAGLDLVEVVRAHAPDLVVIDMELPDRDALEGVRALSAYAPRPIVMFSDKDDPAFVSEAISAGVCSYNLSNVATRDIKTIVAAAVALFRRYAKVESELAAAQAQLSERRIVERAKAALMSQRKINEPQAYKWLRTKAMNESRKLVDVALEVVRAGEVVREGEAP